MKVDFLFQFDHLIRQLDTQCKTIQRLAKMIIIVTSFIYFYHLQLLQKAINNQQVSNYFTHIRKVGVGVLLTICYQINQKYSNIRIELSLKNQLDRKQKCIIIMGYCHYWSMLKIPSQLAIENVLTQLKVIRPLCNIPIQYQQNDTRPPVFTNKLIRFNGVEQDGHQTFLVSFQEIIKSAGCKTNHKPYDSMVCMTLLSLRNHLQNFQISSDGSEEEWIPIIKFYQTKIGKLNFDYQNLFEGQQC